MTGQHTTSLEVKPVQLLVLGVAYINVHYQSLAIPLPNAENASRARSAMYSSFDPPDAIGHLPNLQIPANPSLLVGITSSKETRIQQATDDFR
jgi:hypothetical protein